jgi:hypothetical protein
VYQSVLLLFMFMVQSVPDCAVAIHVYGSKEVYQTAPLLFRSMAQSKCTSLGWLFMFMGSK